MPVLSHLHQLFNADQCQTSIHTLRWKDRPLQCPRCQNYHIGRWGTYHYRPGCKHYCCHHCKRTFNDLTHTLLHQSQRPLEMQRQLEGTVEADDLYHTAGNKGQAQHGGKKALGRRARGRHKKREPGRGHYDKDRPAIIAWVSRQGAVVIHATKDCTVQTVQKATNLAMQAGSRLYTDSASSYRAVKGYVHAFVNHTQQEYARGDVHENRAECLFSLLKPYLRVFRGVSKFNLPGYVGFFQFLRNFRQHNAFEQAELILQAAFDPAIARRARRGEFVACFDHFDLLQTAIN